MTIFRAIGWGLGTGFAWRMSWLMSIFAGATFAVPLFFKNFDFQEFPQSVCKTMRLGYAKVGRRKLPPPAGRFGD